MLRERLGEGGFGVVYRAHQPELDREVAVKLIHPAIAESAGFAARFEDEASVIARLEHPNIVPLYEFGRDEEEAWLVMRLFRGGSLADALEKGPWKPKMAAALLEQLAAALALAHRHGIVHRDVKPGNILLDPDGTAYLADFGISFDAFAGDLAVEAGPGSPIYMAPEQLEGEPVTDKTDVYSLGVVMHEVLTGDLPWRADTVVEILRRRLDEPLPEIHVIRPDLSPALTAAVQAATARDPEDRPSLDEFAASFAAATTQTSAAATTHLPDYPTSFVGRLDDIQRITDLLQQDDCRLVTVVGPGGIGKTRLSVEASRQAAAAMGSTPHFATLSAVTRPDAVVKSIGDSLGFTIDIHLSQVVDEKTQLLDLLAAQRLVLVLDNFEHLLEAAGTVSEILDACPELKLIATSRERLRLAGEWAFEVEGLGSAEDGEADAIELFVARARQAGGDTSIERDGEVISSLCRLVGGMPLAIELAAAWTAALPVGEIVSEVERSVDFLAGTLRDVPERHRSLRAAFDYSWQLLEPDLQAALGRLAVFAAPFSREAAAEAADTGVATLMELMSKSLVRRADVGAFDLHPMIREFGLEMLGDGRDAAEERFARYYLQRLLDQEDRLQGSIDQFDARDEVAAEIDNIRAGVRWAIQNDETELLVFAFDALHPYFFLDSLSAGLHDFEAFADQIQEHLGTAAVLSNRACLVAQVYQAENVAQLGKADEATALAMSNLPRVQQLGGRHLAYTYLTLGIACELRGELDEARSWLEKADALEVGDLPLLTSELQAWYGWVVIQQGELEEAVAIWEAAYALISEANHHTGQAYLASKLGIGADELGDHSRAADYHHQAREIFVKAGDRAGQGYAYSRLSWTYWLTGDYDKACEYGQEGLEHFESVHHRWGIAASWCRIGLAQIGLGELDDAAVSLRTALDLAVDGGITMLTMYALMGIGRLLPARGDVDAAAVLLVYNANFPQNPYADMSEEPLAVVSGQLGAEAMAEAEKRAGELSIDEAAAYARSAL